MFGRNRITLPIFSKGKVAYHKGNKVTVDHVILRGHDLYVAIHAEKPTHIYASELDIEPTTIILERKKNNNAENSLHLR